MAAPSRLKEGLSALALVFKMGGWVVVLLGAVVFAAFRRGKAMGRIKATTKAANDRVEDLVKRKDTEGLRDDILKGTK